MSKEVNTKPVVVKGENDGLDYYLYAVEYEHAGGKWAFDLYALDEADAKQKVQDIKASLVYLGPITEVIPA